MPVDPAMRVAVVVSSDGTPHNHPMPPPVKVSYHAKEDFIKCCKASGVIGMSVKKVDNGE